MVVDVLRGHSVRPRFNDIGFDHYRMKIGEIEVRKLTKAMLSAIKDIVGDTERTPRIIAVWRKLFEIGVEAFVAGVERAKAADETTQGERDTEQWGSQTESELPYAEEYDDAETKVSVRISRT